jgi:hypothetical protein
MAAGGSGPPHYSTLASQSFNELTSTIKIESGYYLGIPEKTTSRQLD